MKLTFIGAAHEVTGSCTLLECCGGNFLIDYGMEQGVNVFENVPLPVLPGQIDVVFLTHAHIDHSGMLPKLYKDGFRGRVYARAGLTLTFIPSGIDRVFVSVPYSNCRPPRRRRKK